jgi:hypothetical protein
MVWGDFVAFNHIIDYFDGGNSRNKHQTHANTINPSHLNAKNDNF